jgi:hypothetical protein
VKIVNGRRQRPLTNTMWIGDAAAYNAFREHEAKAREKYERGRAINGVLFADEFPLSPASDLYSIMRHIVSDPRIESVGDFVYVIGSRPDGFRFSVYSDMLFDWPNDKPDDYELSLLDKMHLNASGENSGYSISQLTPEFIGTNMVAFYFVRTHSLFLFSGQIGSLATECRAIRNVPPQNVAAALKQVLGFDYRWLALVTSAADRNASRYGESRPEGDSYGLSLGIFYHLNTLPHSGASGEPKDRHGPRL